MEDFKEGLAELLEVDDVNENEILEDFEAWDSLTILSIIAFIDENYKVSVSAQDFKDVKNIGGLENLVMLKYKK